MAKRTKVLRARREESVARDVDDSLLIRSAESLGRVIGSLQRQVRSGTSTVTSIADEARSVLSELTRFDEMRQDPPTSARKRPAPRKTTARKATAARKRKTASARKTTSSRKRTAARKSSKKR
jgi:hypothetical protein